MIGAVRYFRCLICSQVVPGDRAGAHIEAHGRVMEALATDESTECGEDE